MSDLTDLQAAGSTKIAGADPVTGAESNFVQADSNGNMLTKDYADGTAGSAVPPVVHQVGGSDGTNLRAIKTDTSGNQQVIGSVASGSADSGNPVKTGGVFNSTLPTPSSGQRVDSQTDLNGRLLVANSPLDGYKATYSASVINLATATTATDFFTISGSATKTIRIIRLGMSGIGGSTGNFTYQLVKRSAANTGGTSSTLTAVPHNSNDAAATNTVLAYTANPTSLGASVGNVRTFRYTTSANNALNATVEFDFGFGPEKAIVLNGTAQILALNLNSTTINSSSFNIWVEWTEE